MCFSSKSNGTNVFPKHILNSKTIDQSIQARKKLFCHVLVRNYLYSNFALKHVEGQNQRIDTLADFTVLW